MLDNGDIRDNLCESHIAIFATLKYYRPLNPVDTEAAHGRGDDNLCFLPCMLHVNWCDTYTKDGERGGKKDKQAVQRSS